MKRAYTIAIISVIGGVLVHLMVMLVIQVKMPARQSAGPKSAVVRFIGELGDTTSESVIDQAVLHDSAPLFMPTRWNLASDTGKVASLQSATRIFEPFQPQLLLVGTRPAAPLAGTSTASGGTSRLPGGSAFYLARFGRKVARPVTAISPGPTLRADLMEASNPRPAHKRQLPAELATSAPPSLWNPVKMFLQMENGMPVGVPLLSQSSGFADWDASLQRYFMQLDFYLQLDNGYYQIWVYP